MRQRFLGLVGSHLVSGCCGVYQRCRVGRCRRRHNDAAAHDHRAVDEQADRRGRLALEGEVGDRREPAERRADDAQHQDEQCKAGQEDEIVGGDLAVQGDAEQAQGLAVGTGSAFDVTIDTVASWVAEAKKRGIEIVPISAEAADPERG